MELLFGAYTLDPINRSHPTQLHTLVIVTSAHHLFYCRPEKNRVFLELALGAISNRNPNWRTNWAVMDPR